jgi:hypothetical protein
MEELGAKVEKMEEQKARGRDDGRTGSKGE